MVLYSQLKYFYGTKEIFPCSNGNNSLDQWQQFHAPMETVPRTHENHSLDPWKSLECNGSKGYGNCNLHRSEYFHRCMEFLRPFHTVEIFLSVHGNTPLADYDSMSFFAVMPKTYQVSLCPTSGRTNLIPNLFTL
jgi:hypothetical protein